MLAGRELHVVSESAVLGAAALILMVMILPGDSVVEERQDPQVNLERTLRIMESMEDAWETVTDYTAIIAKEERFRDGTVRSQRVLLKFRKPDDHYLAVREGPNEGAELLYPTGDGNDLILAHPGGFTGTVARFLGRLPGIRRAVPEEFSIEDPRVFRGQHHTILDLNLGKMAGLISRAVRTAAEYGEGQIIVHPSEDVDGRPAEVLELLYPPDAGFMLTVQEGDTVFSVARESGQDVFAILYNNPEIGGATDLRAGQRIFVPRYYAARAVVWIGYEPRLPLRMEIYDGQGRLYESYEHSELAINIGLTDMDFDRGNPEYHFR